MHRFVSAIFGKSVKIFLSLDFRLYCFFYFAYVSGKDQAILGESPAMKLACTFTLIKKLFEGASTAIGATQPKPPTMKRITDIMAPFSVVPERVKLGKRSTCCMGVMCGLELSKSYHPEMKPELLEDGFPELKADRSKFSEADYINIVKETCIFATKIVDEVDLSNFEPCYDECNKRRKIPSPERRFQRCLPPR